MIEKGTTPGTRRQTHFLNAAEDPLFRRYMEASKKAAAARERRQNAQAAAIAQERAERLRKAEQIRQGKPQAAKAEQGKNHAQIENAWRNLFSAIMGNKKGHRSGRRH